MFWFRHSNDSCPRSETGSHRNIGDKSMIGSVLFWLLAMLPPLPLAELLKFEKNFSPGKGFFRKVLYSTFFELC